MECDEPASSSRTRGIDGEERARTVLSCVWSKGKLGVAYYDSLLDEVRA